MTTSNRFLAMSVVSIALSASILLRAQEPPVDRGLAIRVEGSDLLWYDLKDVGVEGKGWRDTVHFYDRLPARAKGVVRDPVWELGQQSAGLCARFVTDATRIEARWVLRSSKLALEHMPATGVSGLDLYVRSTDGSWHWLAQGRPSQAPLNQKPLVSGLSPGSREYLLYLPLYNGVDSVQIGILPEASISRAPARPPDRARPICVYGTSITQGGCASRPGMVHTSIIGRRLDREVINLGFSGNGPMELEVGRLLTDIDAAVFVLDCLPNMSEAQVKERAVPMVRMLRYAHPETPIVLVENIIYQNAEFLPDRREGYLAKNKALRTAYESLLAEGQKDLSHVRCEGLLGRDGEATVDGTHPTDLGFLRMADALEPAIRDALKVADSRRKSAALTPSSRLSRWVEANVLAVHAYQIQLRKKSGRGDALCFAPGKLSDAELAGIVDHQARLLESDPEAVRAWMRGEASAFDPSRDLQPILESGLAVSPSAPVNVMSRYLQKHVRAPSFEARGVAALYQTILEVDRDGDLLQQEFDTWIRLGLPIYAGQFGLPGTDEAFLAAGRELAESSCPSPFDTDPAAWQIAGRKIWNWGEKKLHIRDEKIVARELLAEPFLAPVIRSARALAAQRIAIIGHSFTMGQHWSSPSSFVPIVTAMFAGLNTGVEFRQFEAGGLTATRALKNFYDDALAWKPGKVLLVTVTRTEEDIESLQIMGEGFRKAGIQALVFDDLKDPTDGSPGMLTRANQVARAAGYGVIEVSALLAGAADKEKLLCLDGIHMKEPYHRLMAREWFRFLAGARGLADPGSN